MNKDFITKFSMINSSLQVHMPRILELFKSHKIKSAYLFGSAVTEQFSENSDVDFLVNFQDRLNPLERGQLWWDFHDLLREQLNREIDLITESSLKNPYFIQAVNETKVKIYG